MSLLWHSTLTPLLRLQFEALSEFDDEDRKVAKAVLESLILKHNAKRAFVS